jgi:hypothetical protein
MKPSNTQERQICTKAADRVNKCMLGHQQTAAEGHQQPRVGVGGGEGLDSRNQKRQAQPKCQQMSLMAEM